MTAPPGLAPTSEPCGEHITAETATDVSTRNAQMRYLMAELNITRPQAHRLIRAYEADQRDARHRDARAFVREEFGPWLRSNYHRAVKGWAVAGKVGDRA